jgi:hypothetical protein
MKKEKFHIKRRLANSSELTDTKVKSQQDGLIFERKPAPDSRKEK